MTDTQDAVALSASGDLSTLKLSELQAVAGRLGIPGSGRMRKADLLSAVRERSAGGSSASTTSARTTRSTAPRSRTAAARSADQQPADQQPADQQPAAPDATADRSPADSASADQSPPDRQAGGQQPAAQQPADEQATDEQPEQQRRAEPSIELPPAATSANGAAPVSRVRRRAQREAGPTNGTPVDADSLLPDLPVRQSREARPDDDDGRGRQPRERDDRGPADRGQQRDRQPEDRGPGDRGQQRDRQPEDRGPGDRGQQRDRQPDDRGPGDRDQRDDRQPQSYQAGGGPRDDFDDDRGSRRRRGRNRDRDRGNKPQRGRGRDGAGYEAEPEVREDDVLVPVAGIVDVLDSYAFVRTSGYLPGPQDVYVSLAQVKRFGLRKGDAVVGQVKQQRENEDPSRRQKFNALVRVDTVNGASPEEAKAREEFGKLTPLYPQKRLRLETEPNLLTTRIIDLVSPIGKGQRGLIVSPPKAGKTLVLQAIANAITTNNPECHLMVVLVDERPEEVTDMQRTVKGEVIASTFDRPADDHTTVAELAIERAKRLVELGHDVVVLLDSITRLGRAYNLAAPASGRILSGGVDSSALYPPKRFFGAARNIENGGSLTILATALVDTGSKMDEVIFEEFKGTGNMELRLSRQLADKRIYPAVDVNPSGTRREEVLLGGDELRIMWQLRRVLTALDSQQAIELLLDRLRKSRSNAEFLLQVQKSAPGGSGNRDEL